MEKEAIKSILCEELIDNNIEAVIQNIWKLPKEYREKFRIIPFNSLGKENGIILGICPDKISIEYNEETFETNNVVIGIYNKKLNKKEIYNSIIGYEVIKGGLIKNDVTKLAKI